ncbi:uncharacterized protein [Nicotiana sylvestris]|uniref:uncharacterized protein n=1 Tax=Nicotiana sylvestris TaxID=4096 RepID=UPI00388C5E92
MFNRLHHPFDLESFSLVCKRFLALTNRLRRHLSLLDSTLLINGTISKLIHRFSHIISIDLSNFQGDLDLVVLDLANSVSSYTSNIEQLDISNQKQLPVTGLKELGRKLKAQSFPFLEEFDCSYSSTDLNPYPEHINPSDLAVTDSGIEVLSVNLRNLRRINVSRTELITDKSLVALSKNCLNLQGIDVVDCPLITSKGVHSILRSCTALSWISVSEIHFPRSRSGFERLASCRRALQTLNVTSSMISDEFLLLMAKSSLPLSRLSICWCINFTLSGISLLLCAYQSLKYLSLVQVDFLSDESMNDLSKYLQSLVTIDVSGCKRLTISTFFTLARNCPLLEAINMGSTDLGTKDSFHNGVKNPRIRSVNLRYNWYLDDGTLTKVALMCPNMEILDVSTCLSLTEAGIASVLEVCNQIRNLQFESCPLIKHIGEGAELPNVEVVSAATSAINDEGLALIGSRCSRLLKLNLTFCEGVTADGIQAMVTNCRSLRGIQLKMCPQLLDAN